MKGVFAHWPNRITAIRLVGALVLFVLFATWGEGAGPLSVGPGAMTQATFWLFLLVSLTDYLDGYLARRDNLVSAFGRIADPFVDKVLVLGSMTFLTVSGLWAGRLSMTTISPGFSVGTRICST